MKKLILLCTYIFLQFTAMAGEIQTLNHPNKVYSGTPFGLEIKLFIPSGEAFNNNDALQVKFASGEAFTTVAWKQAAAKSVSGGKEYTLTATPLASASTGDKTMYVKFGSNPQATSSIKVNANVLLGGARITVGYQGWFGTPNDGSLNRWNHWFENNNDQNHPTQDLWPLVNESDYPDREKTDITMNNGSAAYLYSNADQSTANTHVSWMSEYGLQAFFVGRFLEPLANNTNFKNFRNTVMQKMLNATNNDQYASPDLRIAIFYNLTTNPNADNADTRDYLEEMWEDWKDVVDNKDWVSNPRYLMKNNKPVLRIYGIGFKNRPSGITAAEAKNTIRRFTDPTHPEYKEKYAAYIIGGVPSKWHVGGGDSFTSNDWKEVYESYDMIQPWLVNRYQSDGGVDNWTKTVLIPDMVRINELHSEGKSVGYLPLIFPGFSWYNINGAYNVTPRNGGEFFWRQAYKFLEAGAQNLMIANFDEVDEGTAIYKCVTSEAQTPDVDQFTADRKFLHLNSDNWKGNTYPADWYLKVTREIRKMVLGTIPIQSTLPISPDNSTPTPPSSELPTDLVLVKNRAAGLGFRPQEVETDAKIYYGNADWVGDFMRWEVEVIEADTFYLINKAMDQKLWAPNGADGNLLLKPKSWTGNKTRWFIEKTDDEHFYLRNYASRKYVTAESNSEGAFIKETDFIDNNTIEWYWRDPASNGRDSVISDVENNHQNKLKVYPNPVKNVLHISEKSNYKLFNLIGIVLAEGNGDQIDVSNLNSGVYILYINETSYKIIKQ
ncbi:T9SS type A sorting domain-containing protein [Flammeovirga sp. MY04]|uniref:T9SS type A sorting domain-containing protein n=1 Tax=Flammeovirga sp. MY04 TaxID=1191459 RepID=UPI0008061E40|nr:T9SS type A sorting domain-containing protein [Flammeovirga sp. MY04]ANQ52806.1 T9SS type A sorting domain-containing protein [Flammeovirga sp. MY04]